MRNGVSWRSGGQCEGDTRKKNAPVIDAAGEMGYNKLL